MSQIKLLAVESSVIRRAKSIWEKYYQLGASLQDIDLNKDFALYKDTTREMSSLERIATLYLKFDAFEKDLLVYKDLEDVGSLDHQYLEEAQEIMVQQQSTYEDIIQYFENSDPNKDINKIFLEIRSGAGGDEASLFASVLCQMYLKFSERKRFISEVVTSTYGDQGGFKEVILKLEGAMIYTILQFESGVHRVQRIPDTETQGRVHTSTCTVAVLAINDSISDDDVVIHPQDIRIDTFKASGAGGQHVNKTDSAVRIVHLPTKLKVECQNDRSQNRNREQAMQILKSRLIEMRKKEKADAISLERRSQMGSGDRCERIRTYNYNQKRVTDHRIHFTSHKLDAILAGELDELLQALYDHEQQKNGHDL